VDAEEIDHGGVLGPADRAVAGQARGYAEGALDKESKPHHAGEAIGVGVDVGNKGYRTNTRQAGQELVGKSGFGSTVHRRFGASTGHGGESSKKPWDGPPWRCTNFTRLPGGCQAKSPFPSPPTPLPQRGEGRVRVHGLTLPRAATALRSPAGPTGAAIGPGPS